MAAITLDDTTKTAIKTALTAFKQAQQRLINANDLAATRQQELEAATQAVRAATTLQPAVAGDGPILLDSFRVGGTVWRWRGLRLEEDTSLVDST